MSFGKPTFCAPSNANPCRKAVDMAEMYQLPMGTGGKMPPGTFEENPSLQGSLNLQDTSQSRNAAVGICCWAVYHK